MLLLLIASAKEECGKHKDKAKETKDARAAVQPRTLLGPCRTACAYLMQAQGQAQGPWEQACPNNKETCNFDIANCDCG